MSRAVKSSHIDALSGGGVSSPEEQSEFMTRDKGSGSSDCTAVGNESDEKVKSPICPSPTPVKIDEKSSTSSDNLKRPLVAKKAVVHEFSGRNAHPVMHARSPSWTEGVSSPDAHRTKMKNVSEYMIDAAKDNPQLAQKLHNAFVESGVVAPPNLFTEIYPDRSMAKTNFQVEANHEIKQRTGIQLGHDSIPNFLPPLPPIKVDSKPRPHRNQQEHLESAKESGFDHVPELQKGNDGSFISNLEDTPTRCKGKDPVASAEAAAAVASSVVVTAAKAGADSNIELSREVTCITTAAANSKQYGQKLQSRGEAEGSSNEPQYSGDGEHDAMDDNSVGERISDRAAGSDSAQSDIMLHDVADCEIPWEDIALGERIGLGTYKHTASLLSSFYFF